MSCVRPSNGLTGGLSRTVKSELVMYAQLCRKDGDPPPSCKELLPGRSETLLQEIVEGPALVPSHPYSKDMLARAFVQLVLLKEIALALCFYQALIAIHDE